MYKITVTKKGQITIPKMLRDKVNISRGSVVEVDYADNKIIISPSSKTLRDLGGAWNDADTEMFRQLKKDWKKWKGFL